MLIVSQSHTLTLTYQQPCILLFLQTTTHANWHIPRREIPPYLLASQHAYQYSCQLACLYTAKKHGKMTHQHTKHKRNMKCTYTTILAYQHMHKFLLYQQAIVCAVGRQNTFLLAYFNTSILASMHTHIFSIMVYLNTRTLENSHIIHIVKYIYPTSNAYLHT